MKLSAIVSAILALIAVILLFFIDFADPKRKETFDLEAFQNASESRQANQLEELFSRTMLPAGHEIEILKWIFEENNEQGIQLLKEHAKSIERLPRHLGNAGMALIEDANAEATGRLLNTAGQLFPNTPEILVAQGMATYLSGNKAGARGLFEQAAGWQKEIPTADFYLGLILIQSESVAEKARGKTLLKKIVGLENFKYREEAGLVLLTLSGIPMVPSETGELLNVLDEVGTFHSGNKLLNLDVLRSLAIKAAPLNEDLALEIALLMLEYPEASVRDKILIAHVLNNAGDYEKSSALLSDILEDETTEIKESERNELELLRAFGYLATENFTEAEETLTVLSKAQNSGPTLNRIFRQALSMEIPVETQRRILPLYLNLPILDTGLSLLILERLIEIDPLKIDQWTEYATSQILPLSPIMTAQLLIKEDKAIEIIEAINAMEKSLDRDLYMALVGAYLNREDAAGAQQALMAGRSLLEPVHAEFYQARIHAINGDLDQAREGWNAAYNAAMSGNAYDMMKNLGFLALELDQPVNALQSLYGAFIAGIHFTPAEAHKLIGLTLEYGNLNQSTAVAEYLYKTYPEEPVFVNNLAYFKFLAGEEIDTYVEKMRPLASDYPDVINYRMTLGLGLLKSGRHNEALRLMQSPPIDFDKTSTKGQVIYAAILIANDQQFVAEGLIRSIDEEELIPEERALIEVR